MTAPQTPRPAPRKHTARIAPRLTRKSHGILGACVLAAILFAPTAGASVGTAVSMGTLGLGLVVGVPVVPGVLSARVVANGGYLHHNFGVNGLNYAAMLHLRNAALLADYYPFGDPFHISAGVYYNDNVVNLRAIPDHGYYNIDGYTVPSALVGPVSGQVTFARFAPYAGLGWGNMTRGRPGFIFGADLGVIWQRPHVTLNAPGTAGNPDLTVAMQTARDQVQNIANRFRLYPVATISFGYRF